MAKKGGAYRKGGSIQEEKTIVDGGICMRVATGKQKTDPGGGVQVFRRTVVLTAHSRAN